jgi:hypothetical protein
LWLCIFDIVEIKTYGIQFPGAPNSNPSVITDYNTWEVPDLVFDGNFQFDSNSIQTLKTAVYRSTSEENDWGILTYVSPDLNVSECFVNNFEYSLTQAVAYVSDPILYWSVDPKRKSTYPKRVHRLELW